MIYVLVGVVFLVAVVLLFMKWARDHARHERNALETLKEMVDEDEDAAGEQP